MRGFSLDQSTGCRTFGAMNRRRTLFVLCAVLTSMIPGTAPAAEDTRVFEMRVYYAAEGKLDDLHARFRDHTTKLFAKHGMTNLGYWVPIDNPERKLVYVLAYPSREARDAAWKGFLADPDWKAAQSASEKNGRLVAKIESTHLRATDFSPEIKPVIGEKPRVFELRTYTASEGNLRAACSGASAITRQNSSRNTGCRTLPTGYPPKASPMRIGPLFICSLIRRAKPGRTHSRRSAATRTGSPQRTPRKKTPAGR
jgi:hypothetical protein